VDVEVDELVVVGVAVVEVDVEVDVEAAVVEEIKLEVEVEVDVVAKVDDEEEVSDWVEFGASIVEMEESRFSVELGIAGDGKSLVLELSGFSLEETASLKGGEVASAEVSLESTELLMDSKREEASLVVCNLCFVLLREEISSVVLLSVTVVT